MLNQIFEKYRSVEVKVDRLKYFGPRRSLKTEILYNLYYLYINQYLLLNPFIQLNKRWRGEGGVEGIVDEIFSKV